MAAVTPSQPSYHPVQPPPHSATEVLTTDDLLINIFSWISQNCIETKNYTALVSIKCVCRQWQFCMSTAFSRVSQSRHFKTKFKLFLEKRVNPARNVTFLLGLQKIESKKIETIVKETLDLRRIVPRDQALTLTPSAQVIEIKKTFFKILDRMNCSRGAIEPEDDECKKFLVRNRYLFTFLLTEHCSEELVPLIYNTPFYLTAIEHIFQCNDKSYIRENILNAVDYFKKNSHEKISLDNLGHLLSPLRYVCGEAGSDYDREIAKKIFDNLPLVHEIISIVLECVVEEIQTSIIVDEHFFRILEKLICLMVLLNQNIDEAIKIIDSLSEGNQRKAYEVIINTFTTNEAGFDLENPPLLYRRDPDKVTPACILNFIARLQSIETALNNAFARKEHFWGLEIRLFRGDPLDLIVHGASPTRRD